MRQGTRQRLLDALDACNEIELMIAGIDEAIYLEAAVVTYGVNWLLMVLGEALTAAIREDPDIEISIPDARSAIGVRNRMVHGYDSIDDSLIWRTVTEHVPTIKKQISTALDAHGLEGDKGFSST